MKKQLLSLAVLLMGAAAFTACGDDDDEPYVPKAVDVSNGMFVVCSGHMSTPIDGGLTYYDYATKSATQQAFKQVNGRELGLTANDALVYGSKMYIVVTNANTIEVVDKATLRSVKQLKMGDLLASGEGSQPRHITADGGKIYVTTYGSSAADWSAYQVTGNGYVVAIDTVNYQVSGSYAVGGFPEGVAVVGNYVYATNSMYSMGNASISKVNLATGEESKITSDDIINPVAMVAIGGNLYYLDSGAYGSEPPYAQVNAGVRKVTTSGQVTKVADATAMASDGKDIYVINAPYGTGTTAYAVYKVAAGTVQAFTPSEDVEYPNAIGVDPITGDVFVASNSKNPDTGYASYNLPGYVKQYKANGEFVAKFDCWVGPTAIVANTGVKYE
ncbi:MAG: hypothetical protein IJ841_09310 [Prevotella sp.]|nr:hypothetical protein [Prevotella sp.]